MIETWHLADCCDRLREWRGVEPTVEGRENSILKRKVGITGKASAVEEEAVSMHEDVTLSFNSFRFCKADQNFPTHNPFCARVEA